MPIDYFSPDFYNDLSNRQQTMFANAGIFAISPDPSQILINGKKHSDEKLTDEDFFDNFGEIILAQYVQNLDNEDSQESISSQDGYGTESNHSMDIERGDDSIAGDAITTQEQVARFVDMAEHAGA